jgi:hypothetical protein
LLGVIPRIRFSDKGSYVESATKNYDHVCWASHIFFLLPFFKLAFKYLSWVLFPLLGGYAIYSLVYDEQKGWYSWIL